MTAEIDPHVQALRDLMVAEHQASIAESQRRADEAAAQGDEWWRDLHEGATDRLRAMRFPWEEEAAG